jgi:hypothetical protein
VIHGVKYRSSFRPAHPRGSFMASAVPPSAAIDCLRVQFIEVSSGVHCTLLSQSPGSKDGGDCRRYKLDFANDTTSTMPRQ